MGGFDQGGPNLLSILLDIAFGFVAGLMVFVGFQEVIAYGSKLAEQIFALSPMGSMGGFGLASAAPYIVLAPIAGMVLKELASVRSLKSFAFFAGSVLVGFIAAFISAGYFATLMQ